MSKEHIIIKTPPKKEQIENKKRLDFKPPRVAGETRCTWQVDLPRVADGTRHTWQVDLPS